MRKINPIALSVIGGVFIFTITYILFWVLFVCLDSPSATQAAMNTLGSYFGGIATLWAACVAAYLFNDWRDEHNKTVEKELAQELRISCKSLRSKISDFIICIDSCNTDSDEHFNKVSNQLKQLSYDFIEFSIDYKIYCNHLNKDNNDELSNIILEIQRGLLQIERQFDNRVKFQQIKLRLKFKLLDFRIYCSKHLLTQITKSLKVNI